MYKDPEEQKYGLSFWKMLVVKKGQIWECCFSELSPSGDRRWVVLVERNVGIKVQANEAQEPRWGREGINGSTSPNRHGMVFGKHGLKKDSYIFWWRSLEALVTLEPLQGSSQA